MASKAEYATEIKNGAQALANNIKHIYPAMTLAELKAIRGHILKSFDKISDAAERIIE